jgi:hypothetical protein
MKDGTEIDPREEKLPKWAQRKMRLLRQRLTETQDHLAIELVGVDADEPHIAVGDYGGEIKRYPHRTRVKYQIGTHDKHFESIDVTIREGALYLMGGSAISIHPEASNTVRIKLRDIR